MLTDSRITGDGSGLSDDQHLRMAKPRRSSYKASHRQPECVQSDEGAADQFAAAGMILTIVLYTILYTGHKKSLVNA